MPDPIAVPQVLVLFDANCGWCSGWVCWLHRRNPHIAFAPLTGRPAASGTRADHPRDGWGSVRPLHEGDGCNQPNGNVATIGRPAASGTRADHPSDGWGSVRPLHEGDGCDPPNGNVTTIGRPAASGTRADHPSDGWGGVRPLHEGDGCNQPNGNVTTIDVTLHTIISTPNGTTVYRHDAAVLMALTTLGGPWRLAARLIEILPARLRRWGYDRIAQHRHRLRGPACGDGELPILP